MKSLSTKLLLAITGIVLLSVFVVTLVNYKYSSSSMTQKVGVMMTAINDQMSLGMDNYFKDIEETCSLVFENSKYYKYDPTGITEESSENKQLQADIKNELLSISLMQNFGDFALVYANNSSIGKTGSDTKDVFGSDAFYQSLCGHISNTTTNDGWFTGMDGSFKKMYYVKRVNENAVLLASLYTSELENVITNSDQMADMVLELIDGNDNIIYSNVEENIASALPEEIAGRLGGKTRGTFIGAGSLVSITECNGGWKLLCSMETGTILKEIQDMAVFAVLIAVICIVMADIIGFLFARSIVKPIKQLASNMKLVEEGDMTVRMEAQSKDEVGMLVRSFTIMMEKVTDLLRNVNDIADVVASSSEEIRDIADKTQEISQNVSIAMDGIASGTAEQLDETKSTFSSLEQLADNINSTIRNIQEVSAYSDNTRQIGSESLGNVKELRSATELADGSMRQVGESVSELVDEIGKVQEILELIRNISDETNLLSLNASIEAARAGEAGRGFAVVANEVQKLAEQTNDATIQIDEVIKQIVKNGQDTRNVIEESAEVFRKQREIVEAANRSFENILEATGNITSKMTDVERLTASMNTLKDNSLRATNSILEATETSSANAEEVMSTSEEEHMATEQLFRKSTELSEAVRSLQGSIRQFKI